MKKILLICIMIALYTRSYSQYVDSVAFIHSYYGNGYGSKIYHTDEGSGVTSFRIAVRGNSHTYTDALYIKATDIGGNGNVGIGTGNPFAKLTIYQNNGVGTNAKDATMLTSFGGSAVANYVQNNIWLVRNTAGADWQSTRIHDGLSVDGSFLNPQVNTKTWWERDPLHDIQSWGTAANTYLTINQGNVGIGMLSPDAKLAVNGTIHTQEVKVDMTGWSDYVFKPTYKLPALSEVKTYIDQNQHLPEVPSEEEVKKDGINLGEMNKLLLKKVEELTLYLIDKDEKDIAKNNQLKSQQEAIDQLKQQLEALTREIHKN